MELTLPEQRKLVHECLVPIRWGDMDIMGHVNNTVYFRYWEIARLEWLEKLERQARQGGQPQPAGQGPVVVNAFCNFLRELRYPGTVRVLLYAGAPGRSSFDTFYELRRQDEPEVVVANGGAKVVWIDHGLRRSVELPAPLRALLQAA